MSTSAPKSGPRARPTPATPTWRRTRVIGREEVIDSVELVAKPGTCAGCQRAFKDHSDAELRSCAALYEPTQPTGGAP
jgi:hypothetical protein